MEKQMQNSIRYSTVSTTMEIPKNVEIGKLIGRKGRNLKPIEEGTAICQIDKLLEDIDIRSRRNDIEKEGKNSRISDNGNHQHATPRNHKDTDPKEKRKRFTTKTRQSLNKENIRRNVHVNHTKSI
ncbi:1646_t:CDS:2 [Rhizophagus irregularis]|nr:1646_t:CDS:2 [Rhizophagus irregularis]